MNSNVTNESKGNVTKRGAPKGNKNAVGNRSGAPPCNKRAVGKIRAGLEDRQETRRPLQRGSMKRFGLMLWAKMIGIW
ncbi:hypothetical protein PVOR_28649 [Paenibacillus vortex V453]|uniref:Uncharacterized protein n=1 Tax=Paenibacillus vortex V453 TaxID=715225 RepID=A0A2R9SN56_9BACL|nr:hypothetical protein PVOR_28649 [Paenibacillus vortex V453]